MPGSKVGNIQFDPQKQKLVHCEGCQQPMVVGKFAKNIQTCDSCKDMKKRAGNQKPIENADDKTFGVKLTDIAKKLDFTITPDRRWRKRYAIDGGGVITISPMVEPGATGQPPRLEYFSVVIQRAVGLYEDFRKYMPADAASDCEVLVGALAEKEAIKPQVGQQKCDRCGVLTDEFAVDQVRNRILCIKPNNCFKKAMTGTGAQAVV